MILWLFILLFVYWPKLSALPLTRLPIISGKIPIHQHESARIVWIANAVPLPSGAVLDASRISFYHGRTCIHSFFQPNRTDFALNSNPGFINEVNGLSGSVIDGALLLYVGEIRHSNQVEWTIESFTDLVHWADVFSEFEEQPAIDGLNYRWPEIFGFFHDVLQTAYGIYFREEVSLSVFAYFW